MHMLTACLAGMAAALILPWLAPHYANTASTVFVSYAIIGILAACITARERI